MKGGIILPNSFAGLEKYLAYVKKWLVNSSAISLIWSREIRQEGVTDFCIANVAFHIAMKICPHLPNRGSKLSFLKAYHIFKTHSQDS